VEEGSGELKADFTSYQFSKGSLFAFSPYQPYMLSSVQPIKGKAIYFHSDFFCIYKHHDEVSCNGVLYNNIYQAPFVQVDEKTSGIFTTLFEHLVSEMQNLALAQHEILVSYLKIFLINAARLKTEQQSIAFTESSTNKKPFILQRLKDAIETNYKSKHSASQYAELLHITPKALAKLTKQHLNKTLSNLINDRIIMEAKRELYMSNKTIKEIAWELGYEDEYYFSRFFKVNTEVSPQLYRESVGAAKAVA
jgi:AraC-like DNA-binding protein